MLRGDNPGAISSAKLSRVAIAPQTPYSLANIAAFIQSVANIRLDGVSTMQDRAQNFVADSADDVQNLPRLLARYRDPSFGRSAAEIAMTLLPFAGLWASMWALLHVSYGLSLVLAIPAAGFLVRLFMIQHDCGHGSFFRSRSANDWIGRAIGVLTLTPYDFWRHTHAIHHATSGNLDRRGLGDIDTLTVD